MGLRWTLFEAARGTKSQENFKLMLELDEQAKNLHPVAPVAGCSNIARYPLFALALSRIVR